MQAPAPLAVKQWATLYDRGHLVGPILAIVSGLASAYVASKRMYRLSYTSYLSNTDTFCTDDSSSLPFKLNVAAAVILPSIIPFTFAFIVPTNKKLFEKEQSLATASIEDKAVEAGVAREETVHALIDKWATLNLARALIVGVGAVLSAWSAVDKLEITGFHDAALKTGANRLG